MRVSRVLLGLGAVFAIVLGVIVWALLASSPATTQVQYSTATVLRGSLAETLTSTGTLTAADVAAVTPGVSGQVASVASVTVGSQVQAGQELATLINPQLAQTLISNQRTLAQAQVSLQVAESSTAPASAALALREAEQHLTATEQNVQNAEATLTSDQAALVAAQAAPQALTVQAPQAGIVRGLSLTPGQNANGGPVATIASAHWLEVDLEVPQTGVPALTVGQPLSVATDGVVAGGELTAVGSAPTRISHNIAYIPLTGQVQWLPGLAPGMDVGVSVGGGAPGTLPTYSINGTLGYLDRAVVTPAVPGTVAQVEVSDHAVVTAGQAILVLSNPALADNLTKAQQAVQQAMEQLGGAQGSLADAHAALSIAQTAVHTAAIQHAADVAAAQAQVQNQQTALAATQASIAELTVSAPLAGRIASITATPGAQVGAQTALFTIVAPGSLNLTLQVPQSSIDQIHLGQQATLTSDAAPGQQFTATVSGKAPVGVDTNGITNFTVTLSLQQAAGLLPGMAANAAITLQAVQGALLVPLEAVHGIGIGSGTVSLPTHARRASTSASTSATSPWVAVLQQGGTFSEAPVQLGINNGLDVQITSGLTAGQRIVTSDLAELTKQTKLSVLGRVFHHTTQRTAGAPVKKSPGGRTAPTRKGPHKTGAARKAKA